jgi:hypothetical protein
VAGARSGTLVERRRSRTEQGSAVGGERKNQLH